MTRLATNRLSRRVALGLAFALMAVVWAVPAEAHVKWVVEFDITKPPRPIGEVLSGRFVEFFLASVFGVYLFFLADRFTLRKGFLAALDQRLRRLDSFSILIMRGSTCVFFVSLWLWHVAFGTSFYLTPELHTTNAYVPWLHLALGLFVLSRHTAPLAGLGIFVLYAGAVKDYGAYHLLDYLIFLGIGYFLLVSNLRSGQWLKSGFIILFASTGLTLIWAALEKFAYPQWTYPLLEHNPNMLMGLQPDSYMMLAGFIEFNMAFILLGAASVVGRLVALGLQSVFVLAVFKFGLLDAIGHLMIVAILVVLLVRGPTEARNMLVLRDKTIWTESYFMTGLYFLAFVMIFILYYGLHYRYYGV